MIGDTDITWQDQDQQIIKAKETQIKALHAGQEQAQAQICELESKLSTQDEAFRGLQAELNALREELIDTISTLEERTKGEMAAEAKYKELEAVLHAQHAEQKETESKGAQLQQRLETAQQPRRAAPSLALQQAARAGNES